MDPLEARNSVIAYDKCSRPLVTKFEASRAEMCRILLSLERAVETAMGQDLAVGPYWGLLLRIYLAEIEGRNVYQSYLSTDEAVAKPHRRSIRLAQLGALTREPDPYDRRRTHLRLTPMAKDALDHVIALTWELFFSAPPVLKHNGDDLPDPRYNGATRSDLDCGTVHRHDGEGPVQGKVYAGGRIVLPLDIRRTLDLQVGDRVLFALKEQELRITPARSPHRHG